MGVTNYNSDSLSAPRPLIALSAVFIFLSTFTIAGEQTALSLLFLLWLLYVIWKRSLVPVRTELDLPVVFFIIAGFLSAAFSADRIGSLVNMRNLLLLSIIFLFTYIFSKGIPLSLFFYLLMVASIGTSLYGIVMYFSREVDWVIWRTVGPFSNAMTYGGVLMILCSIALAVVVSNGVSGRLRTIGLIALVSTAVALFVTFTRSSWLGMIASTLVILGIARRKLVPPFIIALVLFIFMLPQPYRSRFSTMIDPTFRTNAVRLQLFKGGLAIFKDHPIVGVGTRDLAPVYVKYKPPGATYVTGHLHNNFLQIAVSMGILGLFSFVYLLYSFLRVAIRNLNKAPPLRNTAALACLGALVGFIVNGFFEWNFGDAEVITLLYIIIGLNLAIYVGGKSKEYLIA